MVKVVSKKDAPKSGIRKWLAELHNNKDSADQLMDRICEITEQNHKNKNYIENLNLHQNATHLYDVLSIASLKGGE